VLGAVTAIAVPAGAATTWDLSSARDRLETARAELRRADARWQEAEASLALAEDAAAEARSEIARLETELVLIRRRFNDRVAASYMAGGSFSLGALFTSNSIADATDRLQFAQTIVQGDQDLAVEVSVKAEELRREQRRLERAVRAGAVAASDLETQRRRIAERVEELGRIVADLEARLDARERSQLRLGGGPGLPAIAVTGSGAIQTCPVAGPNSFVDSFGDPRSGGRSHEGIDLIAAYGTPVVAVAPGTASTAGSIGGLGATVQHANGDWTFYAHLSRYGTLGAVSAGTVIGYVGPGNGVNHLHFEYHPHGGAAVNPYSALLAVC
jgi:peptidoglycan LD-endopeptidase LytH